MKLSATLPKDAPLDPFKIRETIPNNQDGMMAGKASNFDLTGVKDPFGDHRIKMLMTKDHHERIIKMRVKDPFKKHYLTFESLKKDQLEESIKRKQLKT